MINFIHPAPGSRMTSPFGMRKHPITGKSEGHQGCDFAKTGNVPILAVADGIVRQYISDSTTYGNVLFIEHNIDGKRMDSTYAHLKSKSVKNGQKVKQGDIIGYMGNTGASTGQHLHFEIHNGPWKSGQPNAVNPLLYIDKKNEEELTVSQYNELKKIIDAQAKEIAQLKVDKLDKPKKSNTPSSWAKTAWEWATKFKDKKGTAMVDGTNPQDYITREQVATMLNRYDSK